MTILLILLKAFNDPLSDVGLTQIHRWNKQLPYHHDPMCVVQGGCDTFDDIVRFMIRVRKG